MPGIDDTLFFRPLHLAVLTISRTQNSEEKKIAECLVNRAQSSGHILTVRKWVPNSASQISNQIKLWCTRKDIDVILTSGGTGFAGSDITLEAVTPLFRKTLHGFSDVNHYRGYETTGLTTLHSRVRAGLIGETIVFCLPGATEEVARIWDDILQYALDSRYRPSSLVDLLPRLTE